MEQVYPVLADHQTTEEWAYRGIAKELHVWAERFSVQCALDVPNIALRIANLPSRTLGCFIIGHNEFGLRNDIALNRQHLGRLQPWQHLEILLHEMCHAWQHMHGKPSGWFHHDREFRDKMATFGISVHRRGYHVGYEKTGLFFRLLAEHKVVTPELPPPATERRVTTGTSKYRKYICGCRGCVRVARKTYNAKCMDCGQPFVQQ